MTDYYSTNDAPSRDLEKEKSSLAPVLKLGDWIVIFVLCSLPVVNIIMVLVWAFGNNNPTKQNFARALLIFMCLGAVLLALYLGLYAGYIYQFISLLQ